MKQTPVPRRKAPPKKSPTQPQNAVIQPVLRAEPEVGQSWITKIIYTDTTPHPYGRITMAGYLESWGPTATYRSLLIGGIYEVVYILEGGGRLRRSDGHEQTVVAGDLIMTLPQFRYSYGGGKKPWKELWIWIDGPVFDLCQKAGFFSPNRPVVHLEPIPYWREKLEAVVTGPNWPGPASAMMRSSRLLYVLAEAFEHEELESQGLENQRWLLQVREWIAQNACREAFDWSSMIRQLQLSPTGFRRKFTRLTSLTPTRYRARIVMDQAVRLLHDPKKSLGTIAEDCGFCNQFHFSHQFKKMMGVSPRTFRKRLLK